MYILQSLLSLLVSVNLLAQNPLEQNDTTEEIKQLFQDIEKNLKEIDKLLLNAATRPSVEAMEEANQKISEALKQSQASMQKVTVAIDEILKKAPQTGSGSSSAPPKDQQNQPQDYQQDPQMRKRDQGEELPNKEVPNPSQQPQDKEPAEQQPAGENRPAPPPDSAASTPTKRPNEQGKWGELPPVYQELFRNQKTDEIPVRYRRFIEDYYRRMNQSNP